MRIHTLADARKAINEAIDANNPIPAQFEMLVSEWMQIIDAIGTSSDGGVIERIICGVPVLLYKERRTGTDRRKHWLPDYTDWRGTEALRDTGAVNQVSIALRSMTLEQLEQCRANSSGVDILKFALCQQEIERREALAARYQQPGGMTEEE